MCLIGLSQIDLGVALNCKLAPISVALFRATEKWGILKQSMSLIQPAALATDGSAILWTIYWSNRGTAADLAESMSKYNGEKLIFQDIHFVFDRFREYSIKDSTREIRAQNLTKGHNFLLFVPLSIRDKSLSSSSNKKQLIDLVFG